MTTHVPAARPQPLDLTRPHAALGGTRTAGGFRVRLAAWVIDAAVLTLAAGFLGVWLSGVASDDAVTAFAYVGAFLYVVAFTAALGGTPGKRMFGLRVVDEAGAPIGVGRAAARTVLYVVSPPFGIGLWRVFHGDAERRAFHDSLAHTRVVRQPISTERRAAAIVIVSLILILVALNFAFSGSPPTTTPGA